MTDTAVVGAGLIAGKGDFDWGGQSAADRFQQCDRKRPAPQLA